jgi:hypothetical protein
MSVEVLLRQRPRRAPLMGSAAAFAVVTVAAYLAFIAWDQTPSMPGAAPDYAFWQLAGVVIVVAAESVVAGRVGRPWLGVITIPLALTVCFSIDAATDGPPNQGLWPIGAFTLAVGAAAGVAALAWPAAELIGPAHESQPTPDEVRRKVAQVGCWTVFAWGGLLALAGLIPVPLGSFLSGVALMALKYGPVSRLIRGTDARVPQ